MRHALVIFDLDGTLVDSREDLHASANAALRELGLPERTLAEVSAFVGEGARRLVERCVAPRTDLLDRALALFFAHYSEHLVDRTRCYEGVPELIRGLPGPLAVATNKPGRFARRLLQHLGLLDAFVGVLGGDEGPRKPDPALVTRLCSLVAAPPETSCLVGDSRVDRATAEAARVEFVGVGWGIGSHELDPATIVGSPRELLRNLLRERTRP